MNKKITSLLLCMAIGVSFSACAKAAQDSGKLRVVASFNAMAEFVKAVGRDRVEITTVIPDGMEPHDFELKPKDMIALTNAQVFVYNGFGMEQWADEAIKASGNKKLITVEASQGVVPIKGTSDEDAGGTDPHTFISPACAAVAAQNIEKALSKADPSGAQEYQKNCEAFTQQLTTLRQSFQEKFSKETNKDFVTGHAAFAYLCRDFSLEQNSVEDVFADGEPSAQKMKQLIEFCKEKHVKTVFVEEMVSPAVSKTLAQSVGADVTEIYTFESRENGASYLDRMKENLQRIYDSLLK